MPTSTVMQQETATFYDTNPFGMPGTRTDSDVTFGPHHNQFPLADGSGGFIPTNSLQLQALETGSSGISTASSVSSSTWNVVLWVILFALIGYLAWIRQRTIHGHNG